MLQAPLDSNDTSLIRSNSESRMVSSKGLEYTLSDVSYFNLYPGVYDEALCESVRRQI